MVHQYQKVVNLSQISIHSVVHVNINITGHSYPQPNIRILINNHSARNIFLIIGLKFNLSIKSKIQKNTKDYKMTSAAKVLAIPELLEQIFFHVPLPDLMIRVQSVNNHFYNLITTSPLLQYKLFFSSTRNPFLLNHSNTILPNPLLYPSFHAYVSPSRREWITSTELRPLELCELGVGRRDMMRRGFRFEEASWKNMLVCLPPVKELVIQSMSGRWVIKSETGVRMGMLNSKLLRDVWGSLDVQGEEGLLKCGNAEM